MTLPKADLATLKDDLRIIKDDVNTLISDFRLIQWMAGFILAFQVGIFFKLFLH